MGITAEMALAAANTYTEETVEGAGAVKGKNCVVSSIADITGGHRVNFKWTLDNGTEQTGHMDVMDGVDGTNGTDGTDGVDGYSPTIAVKTSTDDEYVLTITDADGSYDTPNLKGGGSVTDIEGVGEIPVYEKVNITIIDDKAVNRINGKLDDNIYCKACELSVLPNQRYRIVGFHGGGIALYAFLTSEGQFISAYPTAVLSQRYDAVDVVVPAGASIMRCSGAKGQQRILNVYKVVSTKLGVEHNDNLLGGKKWVACGDSFTAGDFNGYVDSESHIMEESDAFDQFEGQWKTYPYWIAKRTGIKADWQKCALSGSDFTNISGATHPFSSSTSKVNYTQIPSDADYVTLMYGLNESDLAAEQIGSAGDATNETLWGAYDVVIKSILTNNPFCKIGIIISDAWLSSSYHDVLIEIANYYEIPYLDLKNGEQVPVGINGRYETHSGDVTTLRDTAFKISNVNSHPTPKAHKYRSTFIENFLRSL